MSVDRFSPERLPLLFHALALHQLPVSTQRLIAAIDDCLPQTQCGLCQHPDGCLPYATAIVLEGEAHNRCVPGGQPVSDAIATLLDRPSLPATPSRWSVDPVSLRPREIRAVIREADCIGCTKCIPACPVDAIIGTGKHMHTIFTELCTGCELCLPPCPVDCIDLVIVEDVHPIEEQRSELQADLRQRYHQHLTRVTEQLQSANDAAPTTSMIETKLHNALRLADVVSPDITIPANSTTSPSPLTTPQPDPAPLAKTAAMQIDAATAKDTIAAARLRSQLKKLQKQLSNPNLSAALVEQKQAELAKVQSELAQYEP